MIHTEDIVIASDPIERPQPPDFVTGPSPSARRFGADAAVLGEALARG